MIFRRHFYYFIVVLNVCIHACGGGGLHVIMKMNRELFYTKKSHGFIWYIFDKWCWNLVLTNCLFLFHVYYSSIYNWQSMILTGFLRTECLFFWLLFVFRIKKISNLLFVTYNKKIYEMLRSEWFMCFSSSVP